MGQMRVNCERTRLWAQPCGMQGVGLSFREDLLLCQLIALVIRTRSTSFFLFLARCSSFLLDLRDPDWLFLRGYEPLWPAYQESCLGHGA